MSKFYSLSLDTKISNHRVVRATADDAFMDYVKSYHEIISGGTYKIHHYSDRGLLAVGHEVSNYPESRSIDYFSTEYIYGMYYRVHDNGYLELIGNCSDLEELYDLGDIDTDIHDDMRTMYVSP